MMLGQFPIPAPGGQPFPIPTDVEWGPSVPIPFGLDCNWAAEACTEAGGVLGQCDGQDFACVFGSQQPQYPMPPPPPPFSPATGDIPEHLDCNWAAGICADMGGHMAACDGNQFVCMLPAGSVIDPDKLTAQREKKGFPVWALWGIGAALGGLAIYAVYTDPSR